MHKVMKAQSVDEMPEEMYLYIQDKMSTDEIRQWLDSVLTMSAVHMNACGEDPEHMADIDSTLVMYENAFIYLLGVAQSNGLLIDKGQVH